MITHFHHLLWLTPGEALLLLLSGTLGIYCEFIWPGRVFPGLTGACVAVIGLHELAGVHLTPGGIVLVVLAVVLFLLEVFWRVDLVAGAAATVSLSAGFSLLLIDPHTLSPVLAIPACIAFGCVTTFLCWETKRARRIKWADLSDGKPGRRESVELSAPEAVD